MTSIASTTKDIEKLLSDIRKSPLRKTLTLLVLVVGISLGAFLKSYFEKLGEHGAAVTIQVLESGSIGRLAPSRITALSYRISVLNHSSEATDGEVKEVTAALQDQVHRDLAPIWGVDAVLTAVPKGGSPDPNSWWLVFLDDTDQLSMLGYHDRTPEGLPRGKVFVRTAKQANVAWSNTASHELLAMLVDPRINLAVWVQSSETSATAWAYEITAPCGGDENAYKKGNVLVSDFVTPAWFDPSAPVANSRFDFLGKISKPFTLLNGGWAGYYEIKSGSGWAQKVNLHGTIVDTAKDR
jgi:hypothetical protein